MSRALWTLGAGIVLAVLLAAVIAGEGDLLSVLGPVLVTTGVGAALFAVVAWRARLRDRARKLEEHDVRDDAEDTTSRHETHDLHDAGPTRPTTAPVTPGEETDRG